jgi:16S rRNA (cytosine1402-N4)-methyltransferase
VVNDSYVNMEDICAKHGFIPNVVLMDLGLSSWHYVESGRGFSFLRDEPLDMRFNVKEGSLTASDVVNTYDQEQLERILREYGEERLAPEIAAAIIQQRRREPVLTTEQLVRIIEETVPGWYRRGRIHCATKTFQALRMEVNHELENVETGIEAALKTLEKGGRLMVISFHGGEDKLVRESFKQAVRDGRARWVQRATIRPGWPEMQKNPKARSAKLKIIEVV